METKEKNTATPYDLDGKPPLKLAIPLGLQHVLAMFCRKPDPTSDHHRSLWYRIRKCPAGSAFAECHAGSRYRYIDSDLHDRTCWW